MISRRNYISITIMMAMVFFLFLFSGAAKVALSHYETNEYDFDRSEFTVAGFDNSSESAEGVMFYYGASVSMQNMAEQWCTYRHYQFDSEYAADKNYSIALIDGSSLTHEDMDMLLQLQDMHVPLVFGCMPSLKLLDEEPELAQLLGITNIQKKSVSLEGMTLYENFLVGGKAIYQAKDKNAKKQQDLDLNIPWFILSSGSEVYMDGILPKDYEEADAAYKPPVIWCYRTNEDAVFAVNSDFMESDIGLGLLTAMESKIEEFYVYPVVNAQSLVALSYPSFTSENSEQLHEIYSRDSVAVLRDLVWPGIAAVTAHNHSYPSVCMAPKYNYDVSDVPDGEMLSYYQQLLREQHGEAGISMVYDGDISLEEKLDYDLAFYKKYAKDYRLLFAYAKDMDSTQAVDALQQAGYQDVIAILKDYDSSQNKIDGVEGKIILQITNSGSSHTYKEDLRTKSIQTLLGYSIIGQDFSQILYPHSKEDQWEKVFDWFSRYTNTYWQNYDYFDETTITETARRCNRYMQLSYDVAIDDNRITIQSDASSTNPAYFIVHTGMKPIRKAAGATYTQIDDGCYLVTVTDATATIDCRNKSQLTFWR